MMRRQPESTRSVPVVPITPPVRVRFGGAVLNDCGPELEKAGLDRIRDYIVVGCSQPTWMHAARAYAELNGAIYPAYGIHDWLRLTKRTHRLTPEGRVIADYDKQIAAPLRLAGDAAGIDLWPAFRPRSDERRVGKDGVSPCSTRRLPENQKKKKTT